MRMLDLFCGRWGWSKAFAARGWLCFGVDLVESPKPIEFPERYSFTKGDVLWLTSEKIKSECIDFICASSPCEQFSVHGMKHFHPNPKYPELGIKLFNHTRELCEASGVPYVMENVRAAQQFVGNAVHHCGPFYLWGNAVPPLLHRGISKSIDVGSSKEVKGMTKEERRVYRAQFPWNQAWNTSPQRGRDTAKAATIPPELANCVADYAERIIATRTLPPAS
jgi:hypothetical protein